MRTSATGTSTSHPSELRPRAGGGETPARFSAPSRRLEVTVFDARTDDLPHPPPRPAAPHAVAGFSLLEVLVVLLLIGILLTMATLSLAPLLGRGGGNAAAHLAAVATLASDQATLQGTEHGLELSRDGYRVLALVGGSWLALDDDPAWRPQRLGEGFTLHLQAEGRTVPLPEKLGGEPQLILYSSGESTPFELELRGAGSDCVLRGDGFTLAAPECTAG